LLVLLGKQAIDEDNGLTAQALAALWDRPQATYASKITLQGSAMTVVREVDSGLEALEVDLPAVVSVDLRLNEPRYVKLPDIMKAKRKPLESIGLQALGVTPTAQVTVLRTDPPAARQKGIVVKTAEELVGHLKAKGLV
jgi:electron transfer flavoprotein beta subunit